VKHLCDGGVELYYTKGDELLNIVELTESTGFEKAKSIKVREIDGK
jgi:hypothetical protein